MSNELDRARVWNACRKLRCKGPGPRELDGIPSKVLVAIARDLERVAERIALMIDPAFHEGRRPPTMREALDRAAKIGGVVGGHLTIADECEAGHADDMVPAPMTPHDFRIQEVAEQLAASRPRVRSSVGESPVLDLGSSSLRSARRQRIVEILEKWPGITQRNAIVECGMSPESHKEFARHLQQIEEGGRRVRREGRDGFSPRLYIEPAVVNAASCETSAV